MARPKGTEKQIDIDQMKMWARAGATIPEMAKRLGVGHATLERRLQKPEFRQALEEAKAEMYISLRSKQVAMALGGNVTMLIWLGKQYLGQKDKMDHLHGGIDGAPIDINVSATELLASRIARLAERSRAGGSPEGPRQLPG